VATAKRLVEVVLKNEGIANKDLAKLESQIQSIIDRWDR
jgi:metallo-beta-lactamase family protein